MKFLSTSKDRIKCPSLSDKGYLPQYSRKLSDQSQKQWKYYKCHNHNRKWLKGVHPADNLWIDILNIILPEMLWLLDIEELHILWNKKDHFALGNSLKLYWEIWMSQLENRRQPLVLVFTFHLAWDRFSCSTLHMPDKLSHKHLEIVVTTRHLAACVGVTGLYFHIWLYVKSQLSSSLCRQTAGASS